MVIIKLSTKGRYGLKAMFYLARKYHENSPIPLKEIADDQNISQSYLEQLLSKLRRAKLIDSVRGAQGGYLLNYEPKNITVGQILKSLEGDLSPSDCIIEGDGNNCSNEPKCVTKNVWIKIRDSINQVVDNITLQDMLDDYKHNNMDNSIIK